MTSDAITEKLMTEYSPLEIILPPALLIIGGIGILVSLILLIARAIGKRKVKGSLIALLVSLAVFTGGVIPTVRLMFSLTEDYTAELRQERFDNFEGSRDKLVFTTSDKDGNPVDSSVFAGSKVTLVNRWEPWCGPCKSEMPDIEALYQKYKDAGFNVIGVYSDEEGLDDALSSTGITYSVIRDTKDFSYLDLMGSVPSSLFVDSEGNILPIPEAYRTSTLFGSQSGSTDPDYDSKVLVGVRSAEAMEFMVQGYLG